DPGAVRSEHVASESRIFAMRAGARLARPGHAIAPAAAIHLAALALMLWGEAGLPWFLAFFLALGLLNSFLALWVRPPLARAGRAVGGVAWASAMIGPLLLLARLKQSVLFTTIDFVDVMIVDTDTIAFLLTIFPNLGRTVAITAAVTLPGLALLWWLDPMR